MNMFANTPRRLALLAAAAALMLGACSRQEDQTVGQKVDGAIARTEQAADEAAAKARQEMADAKAATERAAGQVAQKVEAAVDKVGDAVSDAAVTASIKTELAKDPKLSALRIDVDTQGGRVLLSGTAPDADARDRATRLAQAVKGVSSVENRLQIGG